MPDLFIRLIVPVVILTLIWIVSAYLFLWRKKNRSALRNLTVWLSFTVLLALTPLVFNAFLAYISDQSPTFIRLFANGELYIVAAAIGAEATGALVGSSTRGRPVKIALAGVALFLVILSSLLFSVVATSKAGTFNAERVTIISSLLFLFTLIAGTSCVIAGEAEAYESVS